MEAIISRKEAKARGLTHYFTGKPCNNGHIAKRYASDRHCFDCEREDHRRRRPRSGKSGKAYNRDRAIRNKYGISPAEWSAMFDQQGRACAICRTIESGTKNWHTDHCHDTGIVRGILCGHCNSGLGFFKDRVVNLSSGITYLERTGRRETVRTKPFIWDVLKARMAAA
jgi:hypothetical protein